MSTSTANITKIYHAYMPEMIEIVINTYENYRNLKLPKGFTPYRVNRKRYDDDFWKEVISEHIRHRYNPEHTISFGRKMCGGQMPWPDLIRKLPEMIAINKRWQDKVKQGSSEFNLGYFDKCDTPQKLSDSVERWNARNPQITPADDASTFCSDLEARNWGFLINDPDGRNLTALILLKATAQDGLEKLDKVFGSHLQDLSDQL